VLKTISRTTNPTQLLYLRFAFAYGYTSLIMEEMDEEVDVKKLFADMRSMATLKTKKNRDARRAEIYRLIELVHVETTNGNGETLLVKAAERGDEELVRHLLSKGADIEGDNSKTGRSRTPLMAASGKGQIEIMTILLDAGANLHASNGKEDALYYAAEKGAVEAARLLMTKGLKADRHNTHTLETPLHGAALRDHPGMLALLLEHGADVSAVDKNGCTALHYAATFRNTKSALFLLGRGASAALADNAGLTALHNAAGGCGSSPIEIVTALLAHGAPVDAVDGQGMTPLHRLAGSGRNGADLSHTARVLLQAGANVNATDAKGDAPLHLLACNNSNASPRMQALAQLLIDHGADVAAHNNANRRPSDVACTDSIRTFLLATEEAQRNNHRYKRPRLEDLQPPAAAAATVQEQEEEDESENESEDQDEDD
jgi:ankyrin repeat protein